MDNTRGWDDYSLRDEWAYNDRYENTYSSYPQEGIKDSGTFKIRTDPAPLLEDYRLQLMNAYKVVEDVMQEDGTIKKIVKIKFKKNTQPRANKQGVEDIISYVQKYINNHTVQGNIEDRFQFNNIMMEIANNITMHFHTKRKDWDIDINDIDSIISNAIDLVELFLTRTLFGEERKLYGETFKETSHSETKPQEKVNWMQKLAGFFSGNRNSNNRGRNFKQW